MPDIHRHKVTYPPYRYSIEELKELSSAACIPFDLSKFTYDAARAGVVPSLGGCAIISRKSSTGSGVKHGMENVNTEDLVAFSGNTKTGPHREPHLPPPVERQKDEGFARFLRKHSSPTHNRVTAGGRIVPIEPRSPPPFTLPSNITDRTHMVSDNQDPPHTQQNVGKDCNAELQKGFDHNSFASNPVIYASPLPRVGVYGGARLSVNDIPGPNLATLCVSPKIIQPTFNLSPSLLPPFVFNQQYGTPQELGNVAMPSLSYGAQFAANNHIPYFNGIPPTTPPCESGYVTAQAWDMYSQMAGQQVHNSQNPSTQQQLAAWQQHYVELDQQLKNIDRHRAMSHLDPNLAEQRRVIVQQRSDAKDTIREYQSMLGLKRMTDSSQDSFATGLNIDAPVYIPVKDFKPINPTHYDSAAFVHDKKPTFVSQGSAGCKAIPIKAPPPAEKSVANGKRRKLSISEKWDRAGVAKKDSSEKDNSLDVKQRQNISTSCSLNNIKASQKSKTDQMLRSDSPEVYPGHQHPEKSNTESSAGTQRVDFREDKSNLKAAVTQTHAPDIKTEFQQLMDAISRPKGVISQVRLPDDRVVNVEGQGLQLSQSSHDHFLPEPQEERRLAEKLEAEWDRAGVNDETANKENISVSPTYGQKAATDAFLSQFSAIDDSMALAVKSETQSLRSASNRRTDSQGYGVQEYYPRAVINVKALQTQSVDVPGQTPLEIDQPNNHFVDTTEIDDFNHKGYSSISVQNIHAVGRLPHNFDGSFDAQHNAQARLSNASKAKSPRLLRRHGTNGGAWYGPHCRDILERALSPYKPRQPAKQDFH